MYHDGNEGTNSEPTVNQTRTSPSRPLRRPAVNPMRTISEARHSALSCIAAAKIAAHRSAVGRDLNRNRSRTSRELTKNQQRTKQEPASYRLRIHVKLTAKPSTAHSQNTISLQTSQWGTSRAVNQPRTNREPREPATDRLESTGNQQ